MLLFLSNKYDALCERAGQRNAAAFLERVAVAQVRCIYVQSILPEVHIIVINHHCN